ncbi:MAG: ribosome maturation factor RimP [Gammaproteobacteria bacterium]
MNAAMLKDMMAPIISAMGYEFVGCELLPMGNHRKFRIYIDSPQGITLDDCQKVSHQISAVLDVEDPISGNYDLEISSPGLNRPLFELKDFERFVGSKIQTKLRALQNGRRNFKGVIAAVNGSEVTIECEGEQFTFEFDQIEKTKLIPTFGDEK